MFSEIATTEKYAYLFYPLPFNKDVGTLRRISLKALKSRRWSFQDTSTYSENGNFYKTSFSPSIIRREDCNVIIMHCVLSDEENKID
jgi:hypothetical protein